MTDRKRMASIAAYGEWMRGEGADAHLIAVLPTDADGFVVIYHPCHRH
ncbi:MAG: hypothetical protein LC623_08885 [Halobacteriales archaeon]|nr:hypothetical protein [Halobacteriales archaeon]